jgi:hypothetical protein
VKRLCSVIQVLRRNEVERKRLNLHQTCEGIDPPQFRLIREPPLTKLAAPTEPDTTSAEAGNSSLSNVNFGSNFGRFWASSFDQSDDDEEEVQTPTREEFIGAAAITGYNMQDLIRTEEEIVNMEKVCFLTPSNAEFRCPLSAKIIKAIVRRQSLKHHGTPWQGSLPKPRISPPKILGGAVVKNSYIRLRGGQLIPKSFKMSLPSMINGTKENKSQASLDDQSEEWPPLPNLAGT